MNHQRLGLLPLEAVAIGIGLVMLLISLNTLFKAKDIHLMYLCLVGVVAGTLMMITGVMRIILGAT